MPQMSNETGRSTAKPRRLTFGIGGMLLVMFVLAAIAAAVSYLMRALEADGEIRPFGFVLYTVAAPTLLLVLVSVFRTLHSHWSRRR